MIITMPPKSLKTQVKDTKETKTKKVTVPKKTKKEKEPEPEPEPESEPKSEPEHSEQEHSEQEHSEQEHSEQEQSEDDKWEEDESEMRRVKAQRQQETKEMKEMKESKSPEVEVKRDEIKEEEVVKVKQQVQTFKKPQGRRFNTNGDSSQPTERQSNGKFHNNYNKTNEHYTKTNDNYKTNDNSTFKKPRSAALSFAYKDYRELTHPASNVTTVDLLRMLIVRSSDDGQTKLKHCLEDTLRAINLECKFPTIPRFTQPSTQQ